MIIYHDNCADGFGAAVVTQLALEKYHPWIPMSYGQINTEDQADDFFTLRGIAEQDVYVVDFSFSKPVTDWLRAHCRSLTVIDHHVTAIENLAPQNTKDIYRNHADGIFLSTARSGAYLCWEHFFPDTEPPNLIKFIDDNDRWKFNYPETKAFMKALWLERPWTHEKWVEMITLFENPNLLNSFVERGKALLHEQKLNVSALLDSSAMQCKIGTQVGMACNAHPHLSSDLGHALANLSGTYGLTWYLTASGQVKCSVRSNNGSAITVATPLGGGGHPNAAGFHLDNLGVLQCILLPDPV